MKQDNSDKNAKSKFLVSDEEVDKAYEQLVKPKDRKSFTKPMMKRLMEHNKKYNSPEAEEERAAAEKEQEMKGIKERLDNDPFPFNVVFGNAS